MSCEICLLDATVDTVLWTCVGCSRAFHAACVGVSVQRNSLRKKDKKVDVQSYVLPCCSSCQALISLNFEVQGLTAQQVKLTEIINNNTEVTHRSSKQNNVDVVHKAIENIESQLTDIKNELTVARSSGSVGNVIAIKNHITSLFNIAMQASKENISTSLKSVTSDISENFKTLNKEIKELSSLTLNLPSIVTTHTPTFDLDILSELKSISANLIEARTNAPLTPSPDSFPSLEVELDQNNQRDADESGWRFLGTRKVWKADWSDYDARKLRRLNQQKLAEKAKKKKKQALANLAKNSNNNNRTHNNNNNNNNFNTVSNPYNPLPPDRDLLAAAKYRFSRPPPPNYQPIQFHRGETLHPYPAIDDSSRIVPAQSPNWMAPGSSSAAPCEACSHRHSSFHRY